MKEQDLLPVWLPLILSAIWLITLHDVAPIIGFIVMVIIVAVLVFIIIKWYKYWVKKGFEEAGLG
jgi:uncharacterized protein YqhQ